MINEAVLSLALKIADQFQIQLTQIAYTIWPN
jgi:hypothetical protein